jgi:hypothetical protein
VRENRRYNTACGARRGAPAGTRATHSRNLPRRMSRVCPPLANGILAVRFSPADFSILWACLLLMGLVLVGAVVITLVQRWRGRNTEEHLSTGDQLAHFRSLYEAGDLSEEEYDRIRALLGDRLRQELDLPAPPADDPPQATEDSQRSSTRPPRPDQEPNP